MIVPLTLRQWLPLGWKISVRISAPSQGRFGVRRYLYPPEASGNKAQSHNNARQLCLAFD